MAALNAHRQPARRAALRLLASGTALAVLICGCTLKPQPLSQAEIGAYAADKLRRVGLGQPLPGPTIDLYEAFARALKYNLDQRVEVLQTEVRAQELTLANYAMLPGVVANGAYAGRDNYAASSSVSVLTKRLSLEPSYSQDRNAIVGDLSLSWNVLDFGLSYVRARQAGDGVLIAEEARRRVVSRLVEEVRVAYWRTLTGERLVRGLRALEGRTEAAIADARRLYAERRTSPIAALAFERDLLELRREVQRVEADLLLARGQLTGLMNLPPDTPFRVAEMSGTEAGLNLGIPETDLIRVALETRSELREAAYRQRINRQETTAALLELLPGLNGVIGGNADSSRLLYNANWVGWGARASWNLLNVFRYPERMKLVSAQDALLDRRGLAVTMAILTQIYVSRTRYRLALEEYATAAAFRDVQRKIARQARVSAMLDATGEQALIQEELRTLIGEVKFELAHAGVQSARANVYSSIGLDTLPLATIDRCDLPTLTAAIRSSWLGNGMIKTASTSADIRSKPGMRLRR